MTEILQINAIRVKQRPSDKPKTEVVCYQCGEPGHFASKCIYECEIKAAIKEAVRVAKEGVSQPTVNPARDGGGYDEPDDYGDWPEHRRGTGRPDFDEQVLRSFNVMFARQKLEKERRPVARVASYRGFFEGPAPKTELFDEERTIRSLNSMFASRRDREGDRSPVARMSHLRRAEPREQLNGGVCGHPTAMPFAQWLAMAKKSESSQHIVEERATNLPENTKVSTAKEEVVIAAKESAVRPMVILAGSQEAKEEVLRAAKELADTQEADEVMNGEKAAEFTTDAPIGGVYQCEEPEHNAECGGKAMESTAVAAEYGVVRFTAKGGGELPPEREGGVLIWDPGVSFESFQEPLQRCERLIDQSGSMGERWRPTARFTATGGVERMREPDKGVPKSMLPRSRSDGARGGRASTRMMRLLSAGLFKPAISELTSRSPGFFLWSENRFQLRSLFRFV